MDPNLKQGVEGKFTEVKDDFQPYLLAMMPRRKSAMELIEEGTNFSNLMESLKDFHRKMYLGMYEVWMHPKASQSP